MTINKKFVALAVTTGVASVSAFGGLAIAATNNDGSYPPVVDKIATKFNLNKDEVKKVFDEQRAEHQAEHKKNLEDKLTQAVKDGNLTEDQKTKLLAKMEEFASAREEERDQNREERQQRRDDLKNWAEENGINLDEILPKPNGGRGHMGHGPF
jgi:polyhydroxyalkanoate synthesis regulator phasin